MKDKKNHIGDIYKSKKYGDMIVINNLGIINGSTILTVRFIKSGGITNARLSKVKSGIVRDPNYGLNFDKIYLSDNYGGYKVINITKGSSGNYPVATIQFINTGYIKDVDVSKALLGTVCDNSAIVKTPIDTTLLNYEDREKRLYRLLHDVWYSMNKRCYNSNANNYSSYGELGISVCDRWKTFENFYQDVPLIPQYNKWCRFPTLYQLDKDYFQQNINKNCRIYSLETCIFLHVKDNINLRHIEYRNNNQEKLSSNYYGVSKSGKGTFNTHMIINNNQIYLGTYDDEIVAANVYNYWYKKYNNYDIIPLLNNVPVINKEEFIKHNTHPRLMCKYVRKENL